jgi:branched-chain amino acid transport system substrate-binding protein
MTKTRFTFGRRTVLTGAAATAVTAAMPLRFGRAQAPIKVGLIMPTTGVLAFLGEACMRGFELGEVVVGEAGGPPMEFIHIDTESRAEQGRVAAEQLINEGCSLLIGAFDSGTTISAAQAAEAAGVPLLVNIASAPQLTEQGFTQVFRNFTPGAALVRNAVARIADLRDLTGANPQTAVVMHVNDTFGQAVAGGLQALWEPLGVDIDILEFIPYDRAATDLSSEVSRARATGADVLMPITRVNDAVLIVRELVVQDWVPQGIIGPGSPGPYEKAFTDQAGVFGDEYITCVPWYDPTSERTQLVIQQYEDMFPGTRFELNVGFSYESIQIAADALTRAGSADPAAIREALANTYLEDHIMYGGPIEFSENGQNENIGGVMLQNQDQEPVVVGPGEIAQADPIWPLTPWSERS